MASYKPIVIDGAQLQRLQSGDDLTLPNDLIVSGAISGASAALTGAVTCDTLTATGAVSGASLDASGAITGDSLDITNNAAIGGTLTVTGATSLSSLSTSGNASIGGTLDVTGATTLTSLSTSGNASIGGTLGVTGLTTLDSLGVTNNATIGGTLGVTGASTLDSLGVTNNATVGGTLGVTGATTLDSLGVTNNTTIGGTLGVTGASTLDSLGVTNNATVGGTLGVTGNTTLTGTLTVGGVELPLEVLSANLDLFIDPSGDDDNNDGLSAGSPFASLARAHTEFFKYVIGSGGSITVNIAAGHYTLSEAFAPSYPYGSKTIWNGEQEGVNSVAVSNIGTHSTDGDYSDLQYFDCDLDLSGASSVSVGDFVGIDSVSGGTDPETLYGLHRIEALSSGTATIRVWQRDNTTEIASGSITVDLHLAKSIFRASGGNSGMLVEAVHAGTWSTVVFEGTDKATFDDANGVQLRAGAAMETDTSLDLFGVHGFEAGIRVTGSNFSGGRISISKAVRAILTVQPGSVNANLGVFLSGCSNSAMSAEGRPMMSIRNCIIHSAAGSFCVLSDTGAFIDIRNATILFDDGSATALRADHGGYILADGATVTGFSTVKSPATNPGSDNGWVEGP